MRLAVWRCSSVRSWSCRHWRWPSSGPRRRSASGALRADSILTAVAAILAGVSLASLVLTLALEAVVGRRDRRFDRGWSWRARAGALSVRRRSRPRIRAMMTIAGVKPHPIFLAGRWVDSPDSLEVTNPARPDEPAGATYNATPEQYEEAVQAAVARVRGDAPAARLRARRDPAQHQRRHQGAARGARPAHHARVGQAHPRRAGRGRPRRR